VLCFLKAIEMSKRDPRYVASHLRRVFSIVLVEEVPSFFLRSRGTKSIDEHLQDTM